MTSTETDHPGGALPVCAGDPGHVCRRTVLASAGAVGVGIALGGCGAAEGTASDAANKVSDAATSAVKNAISKVAIPVGGGKVFADQKVVVTQPTAGDYKAFSAVCTHQGCIVHDVSNGTINCLCHGSAFDITTGDVKAGPATQPLPAKGVTVSGTGITVS